MNGRLEIDPDAAEVVKTIFQMAAAGMSFAEITRELNRQGIATCDEQKAARGEKIQFKRFETITKKRWNPTSVSAIIRDEIYIGTRIWGKTRCSMHTGFKSILNDEADWIRLENHHAPIIDRELFEKANRLHPRKTRGVSETRTNYMQQRRKKRPALLLCSHCGHCLVKETEHMLKCSDGRTSGDPVCRNLSVRREPLEKHILELVHQFAASMLESRKNVQAESQCGTTLMNVSELSKRSRQLSSEKMKLYGEYKKGRISREVYQQRSGELGRQLEEIRQKMHPKMESDLDPCGLENLSNKIDPEEFLNMKEYDSEKLRQIIKAVRVKSQTEIEVEWNFDVVFQEQN